jgi:DNA-binding response OmpR family regulator
MSQLKLNFRSVTTLILDRDRYTRSLIGQMLRGFGVGGIETLDTGEAGMAYVKENYVDLIILEANLPDMSGADFIRWIRREQKEPLRFVPILVLSGYTQMRMISQVRDAGANIVVKKPVSAQMMFDRVGWIARTPRAYLETGDYVGPDRRFKETTPPNGEFRRETDFNADGTAVPQASGTGA